MFQVKGWVSEQPNANLLIKQIHLDYLGLRDIKQVPSLLCKVPAVLLARAWADRPREQRIQARSVSCTHPWAAPVGHGEYTRALAQHTRAVLTCAGSVLFRFLLQGLKGSTFPCAWWVPGWCWGEGLGGQGWLQFLLHQCVRHGHSPYTALLAFTSSWGGLVRH